jgi:hypothetical protein
VFVGVTVCVGVIVGVIVGVAVGVTDLVGVGVGVNGTIHPTMNDHNVSTSLLSTGLTTTFTLSEEPSTVIINVPSSTFDVEV